MSYKPKFFADTRIAKAVALQLRMQGFDVLRCEDVGMAEAADVDLLTYATQVGRVMLTCDKDFRLWYYDWIADGKSHTGIIKFDQEEHCQNIGRIVKIVKFFYELVDDPVDSVNMLYEGGDFE